MNSFDAWDTLIARRHLRDEWHYKMREGASEQDACAFELANLIPIVGNVRKVQPDDVIVSDYGDGTPKYHDFLTHALKTVCGLDNKVVVTPGGKYEGTVWSSLSPKPATHTGDNFRADVESANSAGIKGVHSVLSPFTEPETYLKENGFINLAKLCREARLRTFGEYRGIELLQVNYNFPVLFLASVVLNQMFPTGTLLFSSRDCYMWCWLMQELFGRGVYWYTSVVARMNADENYHRYIKSFGPDPVLVDISGSGTSFSKLPEYKSVLLYRPQRGVQSIPAMVSTEDCMRLEQANCAPHEKCIGVDAKLTPQFKSSGEYAVDHHVKAQVDAFKLCDDLLPFYGLTSELNADTFELNADTALLLKVMSHLMHQYINFADAVEPLRQLAITEDR